MQDLVDKMALLIEQPDIAQVIGDESRLFVARHFDWKDIAETTEYLYEMIQMEPERNKYQESRIE